MYKIKSQTSIRNVTKSVTELLTNNHTTKLEWKNWRNQKLFCWCDSEILHKVQTVTDEVVTDKQ